ncbi:MAG: hypothetical protein K0B14_11590 [Anaerolineaceae bacterium]|nr:hypothetical protein [Anaerolineaceae bacterium]
MSTVSNFLLIFLLLIITSLYLFGLGNVFVNLVFAKNNTDENKEESLNSFAFTLLSGILMNYLLILIFQTLKTSFFIGSIISFFGFLLLIKKIIITKSNRKIDRFTIFKLVGSLIILFLIFSPIVTEPLADWDARSIWFFHAKMIFSSGTIGESAGWSHASVGFSHPDYPKLVPALAGQINYIAGFWNEYLPKISILLLFIPTTIWIMTFAKNSLSFLFLVISIPLGFFPWIWNGYMDGLLAIYVSVALLLMGRYFQKRNKTDLMSGLLLLFCIMNIKNEGILAFIAILFIFIIIHLITIKIGTLRDHFSITKKFFLFGLISLLPFFIWNFYKSQWGLTNDLAIGLSQTIQNIFNRLQDGSYITILSRSYSEMSSWLLILGMLLIASVIRNKTPDKAVFFSLLSTLIVFIGIFSVYLFTPNDLVWHLDTSISRTMLPINGGIIVASYYLIEKIQA